MNDRQCRWGPWDDCTAVTLRAIRGSPHKLTLAGLPECPELTESRRETCVFIHGKGLLGQIAPPFLSLLLRLSDLPQDDPIALTPNGCAAFSNVMPVAEV